MKELKIYIAGKMSGLTYEKMNGWREKLKRKIEMQADLIGYKDKLCVINPVNYYNFENYRHQSETEVEDYDLAHVISSDVIIVNLDGLNSSIGTIIELHDANYHHRIPVIAFGSEDNYNKLHPWIKRDITRYEETMDDVITYIGDFYMI